MATSQKIESGGEDLKSKVIEFLIEKIRKDGKVDAFLDHKIKNGPKLAKVVAQSLEKKNGWEGLQMIVYGRACVHFIFEDEKIGLFVRLPFEDFCKKMGLPEEETREQLANLF
ncbi:MAG: hypothetical protein ABIE14_04320 [Patescibacteria group bacterium]